MPEPDGPMIAVNVAARQRQRDAVERADLAVAAPEDAHDVVEVHHRLRPCPVAMAAVGAYVMRVMRRNVSRRAAGRLPHAAWGR